MVYMRVIVMEKPEENNTKFSFFRRKKEFILFLTILFMLAACKKTGQSAENTVDSVVDSAAETVQELPRQSGREAVLLRGNQWINGIPGFEDNSFRALTGEYRINSSALEEEKHLWVYLSSEPLYFSGEWQARQGMGNIQVFQRSTGEELMAAAILDDGKGVFWTAVFHFPLGTEGFAVSEDTISKFLRAWSSRFLYFLSLARNPGEISIPAVVEF